MKIFSDNSSLSISLKPILFELIIYFFFFVENVFIPNPKAPTTRYNRNVEIGNPPTQFGSSGGHGPGPFVVASPAIGTTI